MPNGRRAGRRQRKVGTRELLRTFLIVCQGKKTEPNYFKRFGRGVRAVPFPQDPKNLCRHAVEQKADSQDAYEQVWAVFDKDDTSDSDFNAAVDMARAGEVGVAYSNEAFELWFVLHLTYLDAQLSREDYCEKLKKKLGGYAKNDTGMFDKLQDKLEAAIRNAEKLLSSHGDATPAQANPSTRVHELVSELMKLPQG